MLNDITLVKFVSDDAFISTVCFPSPLAGLLSQGSLGWCAGGVAGTSFGSLAVLQLAAGSSRAGSSLGEVWTH